METVIAVVVAIAVTAIVVYFVTSAYHKKVTEAKIGNAEEKAREIIDEAVKTAETKKREAMLEAKEESIRVKNDLDKEVKERRAEIQRSERRVVQRIWTRSLSQSRDAKRVLLQRKKRSTNRKRRSQSSMKSGYRNWNESPD